MPAHVHHQIPSAITPFDPHYLVGGRSTQSAQAVAKANWIKREHFLMDNQIFHHVQNEQVALNSALAGFEEFVPNQKPEKGLRTTFLKPYMASQAFQVTPNSS